MALAPDLGCAPARLLPMTRDHIEAVAAIEQVSQTHPWSRRMFEDCLDAGYSGWVLEAEGPAVVAFAVSSLAMDDAHLLNLAVAPTARRGGLARRLLDHVLAQARAAEAQRVLLEVRESNGAAVGLYADAGFRLLARRRGYYPAAGGRREDALVMVCALADGVGGGA